MTEEQMTQHEIRKAKNPNFNTEKSEYMRQYHAKNKEKIRLYNIERFARIKAKKIADAIELEDLTNLMRDFQNV